jgi:hypothetical protein
LFKSHSPVRSHSPVKPKDARRALRRTLAAGLGLAVAGTLIAAGPAQAFTNNVRVDLKVLVFNDGSAGVATITAALDREGVPYDQIRLAGSVPTLTAAQLSDTLNGAPRARYDGVVVPSENALGAANTALLNTFEQTFGIRQVDAYTWAGANVGLTAAFTGTLDGATATVTAAGRSAGFGYLTGSLPIDNLDPSVPETYGYLGTPAAATGTTFTPLVNAALGGRTGSVMGVYTHGGHDELVVTMGMNQYQMAGQELGHGVVTWLTQGTHLGYWRNWFSLNVDDIFLPDDRWDATHNCTSGDDCASSLTPLAPVRMTTADVTYLEQWQNRAGIKLDVTFNGDGSVEAGNNDALTRKFVADRSQFRWLNHTYSHEYLGCLQNFTIVPWACQTGTGGQIQYTSQADITSQITQNVAWAKRKGITLNASEVVTGEHSGLASLPQMSVDNPNLAPALAAAGITALASDASREPAPRGVGAARTVPRHPLNIYYNVASRADEVDEYNWLYASQSAGGSGICENNPSSTCISPLSASTGFTSYIVPLETRIAYGHVVSSDPAPHYAHQSNLTGDRILYPVLNSVINRYKATYTTATPLLNPRLSDVSTQQSRAVAWHTASTAGQVEAYLQNGRVTVINHGGGPLSVPITVPASTKSVTLSVLGVEMLGAVYGTAYGTDRSDWTSFGAGATKMFRLPG